MLSWAKYVGSQIESSNGAAGCVLYGYAPSGRYWPAGVDPLPDVLGIDPDCPRKGALAANGLNSFADADRFHGWTIAKLSVLVNSFAYRRVARR